MPTTGKEPKNESAMMAPAMGKRLLQARTMLLIFVAVMLFILEILSDSTLTQRLLWKDPSHLLLKTVHIAVIRPNKG